MAYALPTILSLLLALLAQPVCSQTIRYVTQSGAGTKTGLDWNNASDNLQTMIGVPGITEIWVAKGTYRPTIDLSGNSNPADPRDRTFLIRGSVKLYGGFPDTGNPVMSDRNIALNPTILSGDIGTVGSATDNCYHVMMIINPDPDHTTVFMDHSTAVDGFEIRDGNANAGSIMPSGYPRFAGGAIFISSGFSETNFTPLIRNCTFKNNNDYLGGGGAIFYDAVATNGNRFVIDACSFENNYSGFRGGAVSIMQESSYGVTGTYDVLVSNSVFRSNRVDNASQNDNGSQPANYRGGSGGGIGTYGSGNLTITNCTFDKNKTTVNLSQGTPYKGLYQGSAVAAFKGATCKLINSLVYDTAAADSALVHSAGSTLIVENSTLYQPGGTAVKLTGNATTNLVNSIFRTETAGKNVLAAGNEVPPVTVSNCLFNSQYHAQLTGTAPLHADPQFKDRENEDFHLKSCSPAINAGDNSLTSEATDLAGSPRIRQATVDLGAFESPEQPEAALATASAAAVAVQTAYTLYLSSCNSLIAVVAGGSVSGNTTAKVWVEADQPAGYVGRHYEITPDNDASTATGQVTLYFTQAEFDAFNAVNTLKLPVGPSDASGIGALLIEKRSGTSSDGTGLPGTYPAGIETIDPADADVVWNAGAARWEVSFSVTGFSGFFVKTQAGALPLRLVSFRGSKENGINQLLWETAEETNVDRFEIERSPDGRDFSLLAKVRAQNGSRQQYRYSDHPATESLSYYRLKMVDLNGTYSYSSIVSLHNGDLPISAGPNPVAGQLTVRGIPGHLAGTEAVVYDLTGKTVRRFPVKRSPQEFSLENLNPGLYLIRFHNGQVLRVVKE